MRRSFTLIELLMSVVILAILASVAIANYQGYVDRAAMLQDETNLMVLQTAVKINAMETGVVAGSISDLPQLDVERAYAAVIQGKRPYTLMAYLQERWHSIWDGSVAEADPLFVYYNRDLKTATCPSDKVRPTLDTAGKNVVNPSYVISKKMRGQTVQFMLARPGSTLLYEVDKTPSVAGEREAYRHARSHRTVRVWVSGKTRRKDYEDHNDDDRPDEP